MRERVADQVARVLIGSGAGAAGVVGRLGRVGREVDEQREQRHAADAVGDRVVHLHRERGALVPSAPSRPSKSVNSHSGRARSKPADRDRLQRVEQRALGARAGEPHAAQVEVEVERGSTVQRGGPSRNGGDTTRWRRRGMRHVVRSMRRAEAVEVGGRSKIATARIVERRIGSFSMFHMSASSSLMCVVKRGASTMNGER